MGAFSLIVVVNLLNSDKMSSKVLISLEDGSNETATVDDSEKKEDTLSNGMKSLARLLASEEKSVRSAALLKLQLFIKTRIEKENYFTFPELKQLWKCLFHCMWICDKMIRQEKLSKTLAKLTSNFVKSSQKMICEGLLLYNETRM